MKTLADFKRALAEPDALIVLVENTAHPQPADHACWLPRTVLKVQAASVKFLVGDKVWWFDFGKASEWTFNGDVGTRAIQKGRVGFRITKKDSQA